MEEEILQKINNLGIGPGGLGGTTTALAVNVNTYPTHIAGLPVAINICCHVKQTYHQGGVVMNENNSGAVRKEEIKNLKAGDYVYINGIIYTARDAAHKRMDDTLTRGEKLPLDI